MTAINTGLGGAVGLGENSYLGTTLTTGNYDDGSIQVDITSVFGPTGIDFFGTEYTSIYINTNGLVTFAGPNTTYDGTNIAALGQPALAPFWTDHDLRGGDPAGANNIYWDLDPANGTITITWYQVEAYQGPGANTFQVVITALDDGTFGVEYIYETIGFTQGFNAQAQVGLTDGGTNDFVVPGSGSGVAMAGFPTADLDPDSPFGTWDLFVNGSNVVCFLEGTLIETDIGPKPVQWLREGDMIATADHGFQRLKIALNSRFVATPKTQPIRIAANTLDNQQDLFVSPHHRVVIADPLCDLYFGASEVFVAAKDLIAVPGVSQAAGHKLVSYYHLLLENHEVIYANGHATESFFTGDMARLTLQKTRDAMRDAVAQHTKNTATARPSLNAYEARLLTLGMCKRAAQATALRGEG